MQTLETQAPQNKAALSTPSTVDIVQLVRTVAERKAKGAEGCHAFVTKKGKTDLFSGVWAAYRSAKNIPKFGENLKPTKPTVLEAQAINDAITSFWVSVNRDFMAWGEAHNSRKGGIKGKLGTGENDADLFQTWQMTRKKDADGAKERLFFAKQIRNGHLKRYETMRENLNSKFGRDEIAAQNEVACQWELEVSKLEKLVKE